ncbi:hypothetical protein [Microcoleus vaginatus]
MQLNLLALQLAGNIVGRPSTSYKQTQWLDGEAKTSTLDKWYLCYNL